MKDEVAGVVGVSKPTARKGITDLESMGYVEFLSRRPLVTALTTSEGAVSLVTP